MWQSQWKGVWPDRSCESWAPYLQSETLPASPIHYNYHTNYYTSHNNTVHDKKGYSKDNPVDNPVDNTEKSRNTETKANCS